MTDEQVAALETCALEVSQLAALLDIVRRATDGTIEDGLAGLARFARDISDRISEVTS
jgi:hypothetical protein